jgi:hypothetical protein
MGLLKFHSSFKYIICFNLKLSCFLPSADVKPMSNDHALPCGLYYKPMTIVKDNYRFLNKLHLLMTIESSFTIFTCI